MVALEAAPTAPLPTAPLPTAPTAPPTAPTERELGQLRRKRRRQQLAAFISPDGCERATGTVEIGTMVSSVMFDSVRESRIIHSNFYFF